MTATETVSERIVSDEQLQAEHFERVDETADSLFYQEPRMVKHIDEPACEALADYFRDHLPEDGAILDLMSSCVSHLPTDVSYERVCGLGMNREELGANPQLTEFLVHDLSITPKLPFGEDEFDACIISVSVQYLIHPIEIFSEISRVLKPGSPCLVSFSNRMFPTKAIAIWHAMDDMNHARLVSHYFVEAGGFEEPVFIDLSPNPGKTDPLFLVSGRCLGT